MAQIEMKLTLVKILRKMKFERGLGNTETMKLHASTILVPREPICLRVETRSPDTRGQNEPAEFVLNTSLRYTLGSWGPFHLTNCRNAFKFSQLHINFK